MTINSFSGKYLFLSNFYLSPVFFEGQEYPSVEHAFQAAKTLDLDKRREILSVTAPGRAKRLGRKVHLRRDWEQVKVEIMTKLVSEKFTRHADLAQKLLATGDQELIEGNTWGDTFWGVCRGIGENHLGEILMDVRDDLARDA